MSRGLFVIINIIHRVFNVKNIIIYLLFLFPVVSIADEKTEVLSLADANTQTHIFESKNKHILFDALIALMQDLGFIVGEINFNLGVITASKQAPYEPQSKDFSLFGATPTYQIVNLSLSLREISQDDFEVKATFNYELWGLSGGLTSMSLVKIGSYVEMDKDIYSLFFIKLMNSIVLEELDRK